MATESKYQRYRRRLREKKLCYTCRLPLDRDGAQCKACLWLRRNGNPKRKPQTEEERKASQRAASKRYRARRRAEGRCPGCGGKRDRDGIYCRECCFKMGVRYYRRRMREECEGCGGKVDREDAAHCKRCRTIKARRARQRRMGRGQGYVGGAAGRGVAQ